MTFEEEGGNFLLHQNIQLRAQTIIIYFQMLKTFFVFSLKHHELFYLPYPMQSIKYDFSTAHLISRCAKSTIIALI